MRNYIVQVRRYVGLNPKMTWTRSINAGADGYYTKTGASKRSKDQEKKSASNLKYRIKEIK